MDGFIKATFLSNIQRVLWHVSEIKIRHKPGAHR